MGAVTVVPLQSAEPIELPQGSWSRMLVTTGRVDGNASSLGYSVFTPGTVLAPVKHETEEVAYVVAGSGELRLDDKAVQFREGDAVREEDRVVSKQRERRSGRPECRCIRRVAVHDRGHVRADSVHARVQHRLERQHRIPVVERDDVLRLDFVERDALPLDPDGAARPARAHVAEREVGVALRSEDSACGSDPLTKALRDGYQPNGALSAGTPGAGTRRP